MRAQALMLERAPDDDEQFVDFEGLLQIVERAQLHRFDGALDRRVRRHHQNLRALGFGRCGNQLADQIEARGIGHQVVDDQHVDAALGERALRLANAAGFEHVVTFGAQRLARACAGSSARRRRADSVPPRGLTSAPLAGSEDRCGCRVPSPGRLSSAIEPPMPSMMFFAIARPRPDPVRLVVKYGSNTRGRSSGFTPAPRSRTVMRNELGRGLGSISAMPGSCAQRDGRARPTAWRAFARMLTSAVRSRSASVTTASSAGSRLDRHVHILMPGPRRLFRIGAQRIDVGRRVVEPDRAREIEHVVHDPVEARDLFVDVRQRLRDLRRGSRARWPACGATP